MYFAFLKKGQLQGSKTEKDLKIRHGI
jgi:hypothetical protein